MVFDKVFVDEVSGTATVNESKGRDSTLRGVPPLLLSSIFIL